MLYTRQKEEQLRAGMAKETVETITIGTVVDTNDPQQMGRVRVVCPQWGDRFNTPVEDLPWAIYMTPFGGQVAVGTRGPGIQESEGGIAYGLWAIPKVNAKVVVMCIDGDPQIRVYMGCVFDQFTPHTMPHGRWMYEDHPELQTDGADPKPHGPYTSREKLIEPLSDNIRQAFGGKDEPNYEWRSRAADSTVAAVDITTLDFVAGKVADDKDVSFDGWTSRQGYQLSRSDPYAETTETERNLDPQTYSITTPGFHALSMDDRMENCRIRIRSSAGHQILIDDTNERIYIATAKGNNWIELDENGNIDVYSSNKINMRAEKGINFTTDDTFRVYAKKGIHMVSEDEIRLESSKDTHIKVAQNLRVHTAQSTYIQSDQEMHFKSGSSLYMSSADEIDLRSTADMKLATGNSFHNNAGNMIIETATAIHMNGPTADVATEAQGPEEQAAYWTSRVPAHEPWGRVMTADDYTHDPEFDYTSSSVNRSERGVTIHRGLYWRR